MLLDEETGNVDLFERVADRVGRRRKVRAAVLAWSKYRPTMYQRHAVELLECLYQKKPPKRPCRARVYQQVRRGKTIEDAPGKTS